MHLPGPEVRVTLVNRRLFERRPEGVSEVLLAADAERTLTALVQSGSGISLLVGPEGGFSDDELALARQHDFQSCRLGPRVLRAETAPLAALAALQAVAGDFVA